MTAFMAFFLVLITGILISLVFGEMFGLLAALAASSACIVHSINSLKNDDPE